MDSEIAESFRRDISNQTVWTLCNRLMLCSFAICLLWLTSLQAILGFNQSSIPAPYLQTVYDDCKFAYEQVGTEKKAYFDCASREVKQCNENLEKRYKEENKNALQKADFNHAVVNATLSVSHNCSSPMDSLNQWLHNWASMNTGGAQFLIPYQNCSASSLVQSKSFIGDSSSVKSAVSGASTYSVESVTVAAHMSNYIQKERSYEENYNRMNTLGLKQRANSIVSQQALLYNKLLNTSFGNISDTLTQLLACTSLSNTTSSRFCTYPTNMQALYSAQMQFVQNQNLMVSNFLSTYKSIFDQYQADVATATAQMNQFYDSVVGSTGILRYIMTAYSIVGGDMRQLCGKSTPNWCNFDPSSWLVFPPFQPRLPTLQGIDGPTKLWSKLASVEKSAQKQIKALLGLSLSQRNAEWKGTTAGINAATSAPYAAPAYTAVDGSQNSTHDVQLLQSHSQVRMHQNCKIM